MNFQKQMDASLNFTRESILKTVIYVEIVELGEYYGAAEPPVRCGESHLSGLTEPLRSL